MRLISTIVLALCSIILYSQTTLDTPISITFQNDNLPTALRKLQSKTDLNFAYSSKIIKKNISYNFSKKNTTLRDILDEIFNKTDLKYTYLDGQIIILKKKYYELYGTITDAETNELLVGATIYAPLQNISTYTNEYGYFSLALPEGEQLIIIRYLGKSTIKETLTLNNRQRKNLKMATDNTLEEVVVVNTIQTDDAIANAPLNQKNIQDLSQHTPQVGGEPDLLHLLRAKAGVQSSAGSIGGLYVRGGNSGHNLVLLDGVPVYNWTHLMGINSIFSPDAMRGVQFYTHGFSAKYGGRLSSVIDIQSREGKSDGFTGIAGINQRSIHGQVSGPLFNKKGAFWISGRKSLFTPYIENILTDTFFPEGNSVIDPNFFDLNLKLNQQLGKNDRIYLSYYQGEDDLNGETYFDDSDTSDIYIESRLGYGNTIASFRWNHLYGNKMFSNVTLNYSQFFNASAQLNYEEFEEIDEEQEEEFYFSDIRSFNNELSAKADFDLFLKRNHLRFGGGVHGYAFIPFAAVYNEDSENLPELDSLTIDSLSFDNQGDVIEAFQSFLYLEDDIQLTEKTSLRLGLRYTYFLSEGNEFANFEPRLLINHQFTHNWYLLLSATRMVQYLHLISNTDIGLPQDFWLPASETYEPEQSWQIAGELNGKLSDNLTIKSSVYYKTFDNILSYPDSISNISFGNEFTNQLLVGQGNAFGMEHSAYFQKKQFHFYGAYTLSYANRLFENQNKSNPYPFQFDSRHYLQLLAYYKFDNGLCIGSRFHFASPQPLLVSLFGNLEEGLAIINIDDIGEKNQTRGNFQHRLDLNASYSFDTKQINHKLNIEIYNIYNQTNPVFHYVDFDNDNNLRPTLNLPFFFSASYRLSF